MATIQELVELRRELVAQLAELDAQIRARHGSVDEVQEPEKPAEKATAKKAAK